MDAPNDHLSSLDNDEIQPDRHTEDLLPQEISAEQKADTESTSATDTHDEEAPAQEMEMKEMTIEEIDNDDNLLDHTIGIENIICEEDENWNNDRDEAAILAAAWDAVESGSESLLAEVDLDRVRKQENDSYQSCICRIQ